LAAYKYLSHQCPSIGWPPRRAVNRLGKSGSSRGGQPMKEQPISDRQCGKVKVEYQKSLLLLEVKPQANLAGLNIRQLVRFFSSTAAEISAAVGFCLHALNISAMR
jgi:hypothetical protein